MKKLLLSLAAGSLALMAYAGTTWDFAGTVYNVDTLYHVTVGPGMTTTALRLEGAQSGVNNTIKNNVVYTTVDLTNPDLELRGVTAQDVLGKVETVLSMGDRKNKAGNGQYIAGVNGDFFGGSPASLCGHAVVDGQLVNTATDAGWLAIASHVVVNGAKDVQITENLSIAGGNVLVDGVLSSPMTVIAGCPLIVDNGVPVSDDYIASHNGPGHFTSNQARTAIGYNRDRSKLVMLVVDKFTVNSATDDRAIFKASTGFAMKRMGQLMANLGCYRAMACDGGGSSQLYNKELGIRNSPYGMANGYLRPVANGFFAVSTTPVDNNVTSIEVLQKNVRLTSGQKFTPTVYGYNKYGVLVNRNVKDFTLEAASPVGTVNGITLTAGTGKYSTNVVVTAGNAKCSVAVYVNGGGTYVETADDIPTPALPYTPDAPMGDGEVKVKLSEQWKFVNGLLNDGWDDTAPDWASADAIKSKPCPRFATSYDGRLYTIDMTTMSIAEFSRDGVMTPRYRLPALTGSIGGVDDYYGCAISSDDAGNFLIGHYFTKGESFYVWSVYSPRSGKIKHFEFPMKGNTAGRIDCVGRVVGDLTENAYVFVAPSYDGGVFQKGNMLHFTGDGDVDNISAVNEFTPLTWLSNRTGSYCQSIFGSPEVIASLPYTQDAILCYSKSDGFSQYSCAFYGYQNGVISANYGAGWANYAGTSGFDVFTLGGKLYYAMNYVDAADYSDNKSPMDIIVVDQKLNEVARWKNPDYKSNAGYSSIIARQLTDNAVELYVYNCAGSRTGSDTSGAAAGACLRLWNEGHESDFANAPSGVEDAIIDSAISVDDTDSAPVYYNLQGVEVRNPSAGIYIVRRGTRVTKEYIR